MDEAKDKKKAPVVLKEPEEREESFGFDQWFSMKLREVVRLRAHHRDSILAFFKNHHLSERERKEAYDAMLANYGF